MKRRTHRASTAIAALLLLGLAQPQAAADGPRHGLSAFGDLKHPADLTHFPWVNPHAPKGGRLATIGTGALTTFDSFNPFILKGDPAQELGALIAKVIDAGSREELETATRALDRVLRAGHYWVPQWYKPVHHVAYWDKYARPALKPRYDRGIIHSWWYDAAKAAKLKDN